MDKHLKMKKVKAMLNLMTTSKIFLELIHDSIYNTYNKHIMNEELYWQGWAPTDPLKTFSSSR